jgi:hypothetical protein
MQTVELLILYLRVQLLLEAEMCQFSLVVLEIVAMGNRGL